MDFEFSADQEALRQTVRRFLVDRAPVRPYVRDQLVTVTGTSGDVWKGLADLGATGLLVPERFGGSALSMVDAGVVLEEMGRVVHPGPFLSSAIGAVSAVVLAGDERDHERYLPGLADGSTIGTVAVREEACRRVREAPSVVATANGEGWTVSGVKSPVGDAVAADVVFVVAAGAHDGSGVGVFAVDAGGPGVGVEVIPTIDGTRHWGRLTLDAAPAHRLGRGSAGSDAVIAMVDRLVVSMVTDGVGAAAAALDMAVTYAHERVQFDKPIGSFQAVQHLCADMLAALEQSRAGAYYALWAADGARPDESHRAATMAKAFASDALAGVGASAIQVLGGIGFTWEHDAHLFYKRLLTLQEAYGGTEEHLEELAALVI